MALEQHLWREVSRVRKDRLLSQKDLADRVGCSQTAISRFENGDTSAISSETAERISRELSIAPALLERFIEKAALRLMCCPNHDCATHLPTVEKGKIRFHPVIMKVFERGVVHCPSCGEVLIDRCQSARCQEPLPEKGAGCIRCGRPFVEIPESIRKMTDPFDYLERRLIQFDRLNAFRNAPTIEISTKPRAERKQPDDVSIHETQSL